jgi:hypothetical protein
LAPLLALALPASFYQTWLAFTSSIFKLNYN